MIGMEFGSGVACSQNFEGSLRKPLGRIQGAGCNLQDILVGHKLEVDSLAVHILLLAAHNRSKAACRTEDTGHIARIRMDSFGASNRSYLFGFYSYMFSICTTIGFGTR